MGIAFPERRNCRIVRELDLSTPDKLLYLLTYSLKLIHLYVHVYRERGDDTRFRKQTFQK